MCYKQEQYSFYVSIYVYILVIVKGYFYCFKHDYLNWISIRFITIISMVINSILP